MKQFDITQNDADQRLDKFLRKLFPSATRGLIFKLNRKGKIKVITTDKKKTKQDNEYKLQVWEKVQIFLSDADFKELTTVEKRPSIIMPSQKFSRKDLVFEDAGLFVNNKNPGQNVHPWDHKTQEVSLIEQVQDYLWEKLNSLTFKPSLAHRIDRDTSGIIIIAKQKHILTQLVADFKEKNRVRKIYFAIVFGKLSRQEGIIKKKLKRIENARNENKVQVSESWQEAITHYKVLDEFRVSLPQWEQIISAVEVEIKTGRMHQIRVHMAALGTPIVGDKSYGDKSLNHYFEKHYGVNRQMLHAWKVEFYHSGRKKKMMLQAKLKNDMEKFMGSFKK